MSTKKKPQLAKQEPIKKVGEKYYFIDNTNSQPRIFLGEVSRVITTTQATVEETTGKITGSYASNLYKMKTIYGMMDVAEFRLHKTFPSVSVELAKEYLVTEK